MHFLCQSCRRWLKQALESFSLVYFSSLYASTTISCWRNYVFQLSVHVCVLRNFGNMMSHKLVGENFACTCKQRYTPITKADAYVLAACCRVLYCCLVFVLQLDYRYTGFTSLSQMTRWEDRVFTPVKWLAAMINFGMTYIVPSGTLNSAVINGVT